MRGGQIAMIFQEPMTSLNPVIRIGAQVEEAIRAHHPQLATSEAKRKALESLRLAAIPEPKPAPNNSRTSSLAAFASAP